MLLRIITLSLAFATALSACGTGISLDPDPPIIETGDDGGKIRGIDADEDHDDVDPPSDDVDVTEDAASSSDGGDAGHTDSGSTSDRAADRADGVDGAADAARDTTADLRSDAFLDTRPDDSIDVVNDAIPDAGDVAIDVFNDPTTDVGGDVRDVRYDQADISDGGKDAKLDGTRDADSPDLYDGCTVTCWPDADYYVDATAPAGGNGSKLQPFKTITAAVDAHAATPGVPKKAYVAPGRYDEVLGERFPLVLRGLSLEGAGQDRTLIAGAGRIDHRNEGGSFAMPLTVTIVIGDRELPTRLSGISVQSLSPVPVETYFGVLCDRGNATGEVASPGGQTFLDQVTVGPGYANDVVVATSTIPWSTGCNMLMTRSTITAAWRGVFAMGCGSPVMDDPVIIEMGTNDPSSGNTISWMSALNDLGIGVALQDCLVRGSFQYNTFSDSEIGVSIADLGFVPPAGSVSVDFKHNVFERLGEFGLLANGYTLYAGEISDNRFRSITSPRPQQGVEAVALSMDIFDVGKVRRNEFVGNDIAIRASFINAPVAPADFGTASDPGNNVFRCNSAPAGNGGDVLITGNAADPDLTWAGTLPFAGNAWDHVPPTLLTVGSPPNGVDISLLYAPHTDIGLQNATLSTAVCPSGRVPGQ